MEIIPPTISREVTFASCPESVFTGLKSRADQTWSENKNKNKHNEMKINYRRILKVLFNKTFVF